VDVGPPLDADRVERRPGPMQWSMWTTGQAGNRAAHPPVFRCRGQPGLRCAR